MLYVYYYVCIICIYLFIIMYLSLSLRLYPISMGFNGSIMDGQVAGNQKDNGKHGKTIENNRTTKALLLRVFVVLKKTRFHENHETHHLFAAS